jgi:hypothetical protein
MKPALMPVLGLVLIEKRKIRVVEFLEEFVPADFFKSGVLWSEIDSKDAC